MWYRTAAEKHPWLNYPLSKEVPEGSVRRLHYTSDDDVLLDQIKQQGLLVDKSKGHEQGDPRAIFLIQLQKNWLNNLLKNLL